MPESNRKKTRVAIDGRELDRFMLEKGFNDLQLATAAQLDVRTIERARAGEPKSTRTIDAIAKALEIKSRQLKPTFGGEFDRNQFKDYVSSDLHIDRPDDYFDKLKHLAALAGQIQNQVSLMQQLIVESLRPYNSVVVTIMVSKKAFERIRTAFLRGEFDDLRILAIRLGKAKWEAKNEDTITDVKKPASQPPLMQQYPADVGEDSYFGDFIEDDAADLPVHHHSMETLRAKFDQTPSKLTYREREIIKLRYGLGDGYTYTIKEIARIFKVTPKRILEIEAKAISKLWGQVEERTTITKDKPRESEIEKPDKP